jgi:glycerol-3-phosphate acyltransferase PlsX
MSVRIALDAVGGDHAPEAVVAGAAQAAAADRDLHVLLCGPEAVVSEAMERALSEIDDATEVASRLSVVDAPDVIEMDESPSAAIKTKQRSSIHVGMGLVKQGEAGAFASAGNTGAVMAAAYFLLGRLPGVARPSVIGFFPTVDGSCILLDAGTNVDCKPEHLAQFAQMGTVYAQRVMGRPEATVGLLNVGEEPGKGDALSRAAYERLQETPGIRFVGNVEGRAIMQHAADVIVCDGFVGNTVMKYGESVPAVLKQLVGQAMQEQQLSEAQQKLVFGVLGGVTKQFDYETFGGGPLVGVAGNVLIGHGSSSAKAAKQMALAAAQLAKHGVAENIAAAFEQTASGT